MSMWMMHDNNDNDIEEEEEIFTVPHIVQRTPERTRDRKIATFFVENWYNFPEIVQ
jgi:hypothetical protein